MSRELSFTEMVLAVVDDFDLPIAVRERIAIAHGREDLIERGISLRTSPLLRDDAPATVPAGRRCACENSTCKVAHVAGGCMELGTVEVQHGALCSECARFMPLRYHKAFRRERG